MIGWRGLMVLPLAVAIAGCDDTPNPNFQNAVSARDAAQSGDPYADLDNGDRRYGMYNYSHSQPSQQLPSARQTTVALQGMYSAQLTKLDGDAEVKKAADLLKICRPSFEAATKLAGADAIATAEAQKVAAELEGCRAKAAQVDGNAGATLKRFASVGMVMVGAATTAKGERPAGEAIWGKASGLADKDMPGFHLKAESFRGW